MAIGGLGAAAPVLPVGVSIILQVVYLLVGVFLGALILMLSTKIFKLSNTSYVSALFVTAIVGIVGFILSLITILVPVIGIALGIISFIVGIILGIFLIKTKYNLDWGKAILVWLVYFLIMLAIMFVIAMIVVGLFVGLLLSGAGGVTALP